MMAAFEVLSESLSIRHRWLTTARRISYQTVLVRIFRNCAIVEAWLPFTTCRKINVSMMYGICILRTSLSGWSFVFMIYANCGAIAVIPSMTYIHDYRGALWWVLHPLSPEVIRSLIMTPTSILNDIILSNGNRKECQSLLLRGIGSGPGPSSPPYHLASFLGMVIKTQYPYPRLKLAYHY